MAVLADKTPSRPVALTIAGSDPSGGAGIQSDLRTFEALGVDGVSVITALTAQNSHGVAGVYPVDCTVIAAQLETLLGDVDPDAVKIGMLGSAAQVEAVADALIRNTGAPFVLDPILCSTSGTQFLDAAGRAALVRRLLPLATLVTPNLEEAAILTGVELDGPEALRAAADRLLEMGASSVLIKGGHRSDDPIDVLFTRSDTMEFLGKRIKSPHTHGTGCFLSSAIAANLALGRDVVAAVRLAKQALIQALETPAIVGKGLGYPHLEPRRAT